MRSSEVLAWIAAAAPTVPSGDTGAYSKARKQHWRYSSPYCNEPLPSQPKLKPAQRSLWATVVLAYDGTSILMSDTCQPSGLSGSNSLAGCGFPLAKLVVWFVGQREPDWTWQ